MEVVRTHLFIEGRVQGVFYRASTCDQAKLLNLDGWVRNCDDGRVEAVFEGRKADVIKMITWCGKGPSGAIVKDVKVDWEEPGNEENGFFVKR